MLVTTIVDWQHGGAGRSTAWLCLSQQSWIGSTVVLAGGQLVTSCHLTVHEAAQPGARMCGCPMPVLLDPFMAVLARTYIWHTVLAPAASPTCPHPLLCSLPAAFRGAASACRRPGRGRVQQAVGRHHSAAPGPVDNADRGRRGAAGGGGGGGGPRPSGWQQAQGQHAGSSNQGRRAA